MRKPLRSDWEWLSFAASLPADPVSFTNVSADTSVATGRMILTGASITNSATSGGSIIIRDGADINGQNVMRIGIGASSTVNVPVPGFGVLISIGLYLDVATVTLTGNLYVIHLWKYGFTPPGE